ncbi:MULTISPECIES: hypothetical protein [unclassified Dietzia]|uniref:hypothetical protein n=1 Tax=unclassified Dietzia TaxID=2617939 RepID=UPI000D2070B6|nr:MULTISPECIES: hypothetical protein [unclassified Dietzia]AVZ40519.1 hypothetical protein CT688_14640 [Dietzia sp. JS16-p6b]QGW26050.1 hypothetical protein GJR88_04653 [Dietzia sp. DQ12-45-1b]
MTPNSSGVQFPADSSGNRSSGRLAKQVVADALATVDPAASERVLKIKDWRKGYIQPFTELVSVGVADAAAWDGVARAALDSLQSRMVGVHEVAGEAVETPMKDYLAVVASRSTPGTETVQGTAAPATELSIPYRGEELTGTMLRARLDRWVDAGVIEPSCADALRLVQDNPEWLSLPGRAMLVLGLGSEMGPAARLLRWGADVLGVDLPSSPAWGRFRDTAAEFAGRIHFPTGEDGRPGIDLLTQLPELAAWARAAAPAPLTVGSYFYADGGTHVQLSSAADALVVDLLRDGTADALAYLATPMDTFVVPADVRKASDAALRARKATDIKRIVGALTGQKVFHRNYEKGGGPAVHDALVPQQGPNYTLAKRVQRWRATTAFADGHTVSINVAPATDTRSVTKNKILAATYKGAHAFGIEIFEPATSSALLAALLVHDLNVGRPDVGVQWEHESHGAASGGLWRQPYLPRTALPVAALLGTVKR